MENTIAKKRWIRLIPIAFITYSLAYLDRANFGFEYQRHAGAGRSSGNRQRRALYAGVVLLALR